MCGHISMLQNGTMQHGGVFSIFTAEQQPGYPGSCSTTFTAFFSQLDPSPQTPVNTRKIGLFIVGESAVIKLFNHDDLFENKKPALL